MADHDNYYGVTKRRPLFNERTPLCDVPVEWLQNVEPKIVRSGFKGCWISYAMTNSAGAPLISMKTKDGKPRKMMLARYVMSIFYDYSPAYYVRRSCPYQQCVNPNHLYLSPHWTKR